MDDPSVGPAPQQRSPSPVFSVAPGDCLRCAACSSLAPGLIKMGERAPVIVRQPVTADETRAMYAALFTCAVQAIRRSSAVV